MINRRSFLRNASLLAGGIAVFGKIEWVNGAYIGDTPTTTDILGPFYRPGAPVRMNLNPPDFNGMPLHLSGTVFKDDGKSPLKDTLIEIWQCQPNFEYDNLTEDFHYRGSGKTGAEGSYHFITMHPPAYPLNAEKTIYRPSHIHLRIAGEGNDSDLITQIYFRGDQYLDKDDYSSAPAAIHRILEVTKNSKNEDVIRFDVVMRKEFPLEDAAFKRITGVYEAAKELETFYDLGTGGRTELYRNGDLLFVKVAGQIVDAVHYVGNNSFENGSDLKFKFELLQGGGVRIDGSAHIEGAWKPFQLNKVLSYS